jgi:hypothetical protein
MSALDGLAACAGSWRGSNTLEDPNTGRPEESSSTMAVMPVLGGRFVRLDNTWSYQGQPQDTHTNIHPDGMEQVAVESGYSRS